MTLSVGAIHKSPFCQIFVEMETGFRLPCNISRPQDQRAMTLRAGPPHSMLPPTLPGAVVIAIMVVEI